MKKVQCNLESVTLLVFAKTATKSHNVTKSNDFNSKEWELKKETKVNQKFY